jgi:AbrB family looped-hinge helix DNA binding protein
MRSLETRLPKPILEPFHELLLHFPLLYPYNVRREEERDMVLATAKLTEKFQITIPTEVRRLLGLKSGDLLYLAVDAGQVILRSCPGSWTESTQGLGADVWRAEGGAEAAVERERESWE